MNNTSLNFILMVDKAPAHRGSHHLVTVPGDWRASNSLLSRPESHRKPLGSAVSPCRGSRNSMTWSHYSRRVGLTWKFFCCCCDIHNCSLLLFQQIPWNVGITVAFFSLNTFNFDSTSFSAEPFSHFSYFFHESQNTLSLREVSNHRQSQDEGNVLLLPSV